MKLFDNFTPVALFVAFVFAVSGNACYDIWMQINAHPELTMPQILALPEAKTLKQVIVSTLFVLNCYALYHYVKNSHK